MSLQKLIKYTNDNGLIPVDVEAVKTWFLENQYQDKINFFPAPFDEDKLRGMIRKYSYHETPYGDPVLVTDILFANDIKCLLDKYGVYYRNDSHS